MNAAVYARVSTTEQVDGYSLSSQLSACKQYASDHGMNVAIELQDDHSGMKLDRPGLDKLRSLVHGREIQAVIVYAPDRLTRSLAHSLILREELIKHKVEMHYVNRGKSDDTAESRMLENIEGTFSEFWREKLLEATRRGRKEKARQGRWPANTHPRFGYQRLGKGREAVLAIHEGEAEIVLRIFGLFTGAITGRNMGAHAIATLLTTERIPTPCRGRDSKVWSRKTILNIVDSEWYVGKFEFIKGEITQLPELAIIDKETWEKAHEIRKSNRALTGEYKRRYQYLLSGRVKCLCNLAMFGIPTRNQSGTLFMYYDCNKRKNLGGGGCKERIRVDITDQLVWDWLSNLLLDDERLENGLRTYSARRESELSPKRERLETVNSLIARQEGAIQRLAAEFAQQESKVVQAALKEQMHTAGRDLDALEGERTILQAEVKQAEFSEADITEIKATAQKVRGRVEQASFARRKEIIDLFNVQAKVEYRDGERGITVTCNMTVHEPEPDWLPVSKNGHCAYGVSTSPNNYIVFSAWLPIPKRASLADELFRLVLPRGVTVVND